MKLLELSGPNAVGKNRFAMVDDDIYDKAIKHGWYLVVSLYNYKNGKRIKKKKPVLIIRAKINYKNVELHQFAMGRIKGIKIDHKDRNRLNNQRSNLRICTQSQNGCNTEPKGNTSKYKGVHFGSRDKRYIAEIAYNKKRKRIGGFATEIEAAEAYDVYALKFHGEFAYLNFPEKLEEYQLKINDPSITLE